MKDGVTLSGQSEFINLEPNIANGFSPFPLGNATQIPSALAITASANTLNGAGATAQLTVTATYPDNSTKNVTFAAEGTSYTVSNPNTASIGPNGLVTALASGTVVISAINDGAIAMAQIRVVLTGDADGDGIADDLEIANGLNPNNPVDAEEDADRDGLSNKQELQDFGTNMRLADSDSDGILDGEEVVAGQDGFITSALLADTDGDGVRDLLEIQTGSNPTSAASLNLAQALQSFEVTPASFVLTVNTIIGEASRQLTVTGHLKDGTTINLTSTARGTTYSSSDLFIANFGTPDGRVFAGNNGTATITVANSGFSQPVDVTVRSSSPTTLGFVSIPGFANNVDVAGNYAFVAAGSAGLQVVDVTDRRSPQVVAALDTPGNANDVRVVGNFAYVADGASGLKIILIANPLAPVLVGSIDTPGDAWDLVVNGNRCYIADGALGLQVVDVTQPGAPVILGNVRTLGTAKGVSVAGNVAVVAEGTAGIQVIDVSDPLNPAILSARSTSGDARDVETDGNFAYVADYSRSFTVIGLADLRNPQLLASTPSNTGGLLQDVAIDGRFALGADVFFVNGVPIIDIQNPANPIPRAILNFSGFRDDDGQGIAVDGSYVYLTAALGSAFVENGTTGNSRLYIGQYLEIDDTRGIPPIVRIDFPQGGVTYIEGQTVTVEVFAEDDVGVASVSLFANGVLVNSDTVAPYEYNFTVPSGVSQVTFSARAVDFGANQTVSANVVIGVVPDPGTTIIGRVVDENGQGIGGATVMVFNTFTATATADGSFSIPAVPTIRGNFQVSASAQVGEVLLRGTSLTYAPVPGGVVNIGDVVIRPIQNQGKEFIVVFQQNLVNGQLRLFISSEEETFGIVEIPGLAFSQNFSVNPGQATSILIPIAAAVSVNNVIVNLGVHITSDRPISVYGLNQAPFTTDAFAALPVETFGTRYRPMSYGIFSGSQFAVVAAEDNTIVTIVPSVTASGRLGGQPFSISLNRYQVYQLRSTSGGDLTGSHIASDKPVAVFSGHTCANVPSNFGACDHLCEQIPPVTTWGQVVLTSPLATRLRGDTFRILADEADTDVSIDGATPAAVRLQPGQFYEAVLTGNNVIAANKPVLVAQYSNGSQFDGVTSDPFMMLVPPAEQFLRNYTFATPGSGFTINFVNIVALAEDAFSGRVLLDGVPISSTAFSAIGTSGFVTARMSIAVGTHTVFSPNPVGIYVYGFASFDSYGYPGGMALQVR